MALVVDTGVLYAALYVDDPDHEVCVSLLAETTEQRIVPAAVLVELDYWVRKAASADSWLMFCEDVSAGAYTIAPLDSRTLERAARLQVKYADLSLDLTDAVVFTVCETIGETKVATLDHRDFSVLRTDDGSALELLPERSDLKVVPPRAPVRT